VNGERTIPGDWYSGTVPDNVEIDETAYLGSSYSVSRCRSELPVGLRIGRGASLCDASLLDVGPRGFVHIRDFALVTSPRIVCDLEVDIGEYALIAWSAIIMDTFRAPFDPAERARRQQLGREAEGPMGEARAVRLGPSTWIGFEACVLPGVTIGEGSVVAARAVVAADVPPYVIVAGNPARIVRELRPDEIRTARA
jgi:acetyltransferase-like isoleucine patch superfamily enzyme